MGKKINLVSFIYIFLMYAFRSIVYEIFFMFILGSPYVMQVPRDIGYCDLQKLILKEMAPMIHDDVLERAQNLGVFRPRLADHFHDQDCPVYLDMEVIIKSVNY